jgi:hypothetical protein
MKFESFRHFTFNIQYWIFSFKALQLDPFRPKTTDFAIVAIATTAE